MSNQPRSEITFESAEVSTNAIWSAEQESFFIESMKQKIIQQPNRQTCTFNKEEWKQLRVELYNKFKVKYDNKQVKNKFHHLKQRYQTFKKILIACSGLGWDEILGTVTATDVWWEDHLKTNPQAKRFRRSGCPEYGSLCIIFGDTTARGELRASHKHTFDSSSEEGGNENILEGNDDNNTGFDDAFDSVPCTNVPSTQPEENTPIAEPVNSDPNDVPPESTRRSRSRSRTPAPNHRRARRDSRTSELTDAINAVAATSKEREVRRSKFSIEAAIEVLDNMNMELDDDLYLKVIDKFEIQGWREAFIVMAPQRRMAAVRRLIRD